MTISQDNAMRSLSPLFELPKTHTELMETYKSWSSFSPRERYKTYKTDAASLIISWIKSILKKKIWKWRMNCNDYINKKLFFNTPSIKHQIFTDRRVYLQAEKEKKYIKSQIQQKPKNVSSLLSQNPLPLRNSHIQKIKPKSEILKETNDLKSKIKSIQKLANVLKFSVNYHYMDFYLILLKVSKSYWVGKKLTKMFLSMIKIRIEYLLVNIKGKSGMSIWTNYKVLTIKPERSITLETSINFSPKSRFSDNSKPKIFSDRLRYEGNSIGSESSVVEFENGQLRKKSKNFDTLENSYESEDRVLRISRDKGFKDENKVVNESFRKSFEVKDRDKLVKLFRIINRFNKYKNSMFFKLWYKKSANLKLLRISLRNFTKTLTHINNSTKNSLLSYSFQLIYYYSSHLKSISKLSSLHSSYIKKYYSHLIKYSYQSSSLKKIFSLYSSLISKVQKISFTSLKSYSKHQKAKKKLQNLQKNSIRIITYVLKTYLSLHKSLAFESIRNFSISKHKSYIKTISSSLNSFLSFISKRKASTKQNAFDIIKKYSSLTYYLSINLPIAKNHRKKHLLITTYKQWANLRNKNKKLCRAFEILGIVVAGHKVDYFSYLKMPYNISYYKTKSYKILLKLVKIFYTKHQNNISKGLLKWKLSKVLGIKLVKTVAILKKTLFMTLWNSWQSLIIFTDLSN